MDLEQRVTELEKMFATMVKTDRFTIQKTMQFFDGRNIQVGVGTGTKIGTATTQKLSVYGVTPIIQQAAITAPSGGATQDGQARTAIGTIITVIKNFGVTA